MCVRKPEQSIRRVSEQGELDDGYRKAQKSRTMNSVPTAVEHCGVSLLYGFGQAVYASVPLFAEYGYLYCVYVYTSIIPLILLPLSLTKLQTKMKLGSQYTVVTQTIHYPAL